MSDVRLIDANALPNYKCQVTATIGDRKGHAEMRFVFWQDIEKAHTIDAVPVVHGRWEWYEDWGPSTWLDPPDLDKSGWKCSNCGIDLGDYLTDCLGVNVYVDEEDKMPKINSCPNCGAKMDAKELDVPTKDGGADNV